MDAAAACWARTWHSSQRDGRAECKLSEYFLQMSQGTWDAPCGGVASCLMCVCVRRIKGSHFVQSPGTYNVLAVLLEACNESML